MTGNMPQNVSKYDWNFSKDEICLGKFSNSFQLEKKKTPTRLLVSAFVK
jgi:hypothetical protein